MFHSRKLNQRINSIHERALRVIYQDYKSMFPKLLQIDNSATIRQRNVQVLVTEISKTKKWSIARNYEISLWIKSLPIPYAQKEITL